MLRHINRRALRRQGEIFAAFFRVGLYGFGGGPTMVPLFYKEVVEHYQWITPQDFDEMFAVANTLPGPLATKLAGYIGYRVGGFWGCVNALVALCVPVMLVMTILLTTLERFRHIPWVCGMALGVIPIVSWMVVKLSWDYFRRSRAALGFRVSLAAAVVVAGLVFFGHVHPGVVIAAVLVAALCRRYPEG